ncbi:MAG: M56 family metallopeptidase [Oscillospiraceae bacterium]|nr:M56 family metallopeptidase [Oscillospiraceae bacterium]
MRDILVTSSVLILVLLILRQVFRKTISRRVQYALWGLVLVRLLVPVSLPAMEHNVLTTTEPVRAQFSQQLEQQEIYIPTNREPLAEHPDAPDLAPQLAMPASSSQVWVIEDDETAVQYQKLAPSDLLRWVWYTGTAVMACWLVISNFRFWRKLCKVRIPYSIEGCKHPVYLVESGLPSPCLFGLFRPAIYLTPAAASTPESLRHVLAHETTHAYHLDPLWSLLRGVCLAVYWFDPLVWAAAIVSKTDCELACDEGALKRLGETERIAYGRTLLSLIPVARRPADPMLAATTMTSGKRRLKDRITRIAENRQTAAAALFAVVAAAGLVCAVTFTGAKAPGGETGPRPLTGEELAYFNEEFFNNDTADNVVGVNIHNQFLTSLYEAPEDIDLFELFYCGTGENASMTEEERQLACAFDADGQEICPTDKLTVSAINSVLLANTGLTLEQTNQTGLEGFTYLEQYGAYYHTHGDTNYFWGVQISAGEREGSVVRLYYPDSSARYGCDWLCVTLEEQEDGSYWFVSNQPSEKPAIPTALPESDPVLTIPLTDLEPYEPEIMPVERHTGDYADRSGGGWLIDAENGEEVHVSPYRSTDGNLYAAIIFDSAAGRDGPSVWDAGCFFTFPENNSIADGESTVNTFFFKDLFGHNGWQVSYSGQLDEHTWTTFTDYYYFADGQTPVLLARTHGLNNQIIDLDGDGTNELINEDNQLFFQRDGQLYQADITALLREHWPEMDWWDYSILDANSRRLTVRGFVDMPEWGENGQADFVRYVYYDGENLLVYNNLEETEDHAAVSVLNSDIPEQVLANGKAAAQAAYEERKGGEWDYNYDGWRVSYLKLVNTYTEFPTDPIEVYGLGYQFHTAVPTTVMLAGGMYLQEDGWVGGFYVEDSPYLVYQRKEDGTRVRLESRIDGDCSINSPAYRAGLCETLLANGLLQPSDIPAKDLLVMFYMSPSGFLNEIADSPDSEQAAVFSALASFRDGGGQEEQNYLQEGLQTLEWTLRSLTEQGRTAYERLQAALNDTMDTETALAQFTANPTAFLRSAAQWPEERQAEICQALAAYYDGGPSAQQARFRDAMRSVTQTELEAGAAVVYELLRTNCALPGPAERTAEDDAKIEEAARLYLAELTGSPAALVSWEIDAAETARAVSRYTASLLANGNGWTNEYTTRMVAVLGVYESGGQLAARYCYLLPDAIDGSWAVWDSGSAAVPEAVQAGWQARQFPETAFTKADVEFTGQALSAGADTMTYEERLAWLQVTEGTDGYISCGQYAESAGSVAYVGQWVGTPHMNQYGLSIRFADGTLANLPLPSDDSVMGIAPPDSMSFSGGKFVYEALFSEELVINEGHTLIHLAGTYRYEVDLSAKTVSLTVLDA